MRELTYAEALAEGLRESLEQDARVVLIGAGFGGLTPYRAAYGGLREQFADRITDPPISELGACGLAIGAAMTGLRPIVTLGTGSFSFEAFPQILNEAAVIHYETGGQVTVPVVFHMLVGIRGGGGVQHSASPQAMFWNTPGLQIAVPASPADAKGLMKTAALRSNNPTVFIDHALLQGIKGAVPEGDGELPFGVAEVKRTGSDVTIIATSIMVSRALEAAETLAGVDRISAEVVDPRTLVPLDRATLLASVAKTGRVVLADETHRSCGVAAELVAILAEEAFPYLKAPVRRVTIPDTPIPYSKSEEEYITPSAAAIVTAVRRACSS